MTSLVSAVAQLIVQLFGAAEGSAAGSPAWLVLAALCGVATLAAVVAVLVAAAVRTVPDARGRPAPSQNVDLPTLVDQSNPRAPGHVRSRAPGFAV